MAAPPSSTLGGGDGRELRLSVPFAETRTRDGCPEPGKHPAVPPPDSDRWQSGGAIPAVACADTPAQSLGEQLSGALSAAGFRTAAPGPLDEDAFDVQGTLLSVEADAYRSNNEVVTVVVDVWIDLHVSTPSGLSAHRSFFVQTVRGGRRDSLSVAYVALDDSLRRAVRDMTAALLSLSNRYPPRSSVGSAQS